MGWEIISLRIRFAFRANPAGITHTGARGCSCTSPSLQALELLLDVLAMSGETYPGFAHAKSAFSFFVQAKKQSSR